MTRFAVRAPTDRPRALAPVSVNGRQSTIAIPRVDGSLRAPTAARTVRPDVLVGEREHRLYVLPTEKIDYIEAHGNYVKLHAGNAEYISRDTVKRLESALLQRGFLRIERSLLINVRAILYAQRLGRGTYAFTLSSGQRLCSGATYRATILQVLPLAQGPASQPRNTTESGQTPDSPVSLTGS
jgi:DNA-binding LytR/AlgR family response regulator